MFTLNLFRLCMQKKNRTQNKAKEANVSIKDIAEHVGVSTATVSLVLNSKDKKGRISKEVAIKVKDAAKEMNYRPNMSARSLRTGKTKTLGLIVADISNPFFAKLARHIENIADKKDYQVMFGSSDESSIKFQKLVNLFIEKNVDGMILAPPQDSEDTIMQLIYRNIPTVLIDRCIEGLPVSSVQIDNFGAAYSLTDSLIKRGCKHIGFIACNIGLPNISKRYEGYKKALENSGISLNKEIVCSVSFENFEQAVEQGIEKLIKEGADSMVFSTNRVGIQSLLTLQKHEKYLDLKYGSIDNPDEYKVSRLPITCIEQPIEGLGCRAFEILFRQIEDPSFDEVESVVLQARINELNNL